MVIFIAITSFELKFASCKIERVAEWRGKGGGGGLSGCAAAGRMLCKVGRWFFEAMLEGGGEVVADTKRKPLHPTPYTLNSAPRTLHHTP